MTIDKFSLFSFSLVSWTCRNFFRYDFVSLLPSCLFPKSTKNSVYAPFGFRMDVTYSVGVGD